MVGSGFGNIFKIPELKKRILYTLALLFVYRIGVHVPTPGIDTVALASFFAQMEGTIFGIFNMFSGGALEQLSVFALGIMPYISASIILQLLTVVIPHLERAEKRRRAGQKEDYAVHPLRHRGAEYHPGSRYQHRAGEYDIPGRCRHRDGSWMGFQTDDRVDADRWNGLHHVARRTDYRTRDR